MNNHDDAIAHCCAECGKEEGVSLKMCKSCLETKYCDATCQKNHWPKHKKACKLQAAELRDEALFKDDPPAKDPPAKEDCPICCLPMPAKLICCVSLPPATIMSAPIYDFAIANEECAKRGMELYYPCCGKSICRGCIYSFCQSGNIGKCPFCNSDRGRKTDEDKVAEIRKRAEAHDAGAICLLAHCYNHKLNGFQQDRTQALELYARAAELGCSQAHNELGVIYKGAGNLKKAKFHLEEGAMAGHEEARNTIGCLEYDSGNKERAVKHWTIAASAGCFRATDSLIKFFKRGLVSRESITIVPVSK